RDCPLPMCPSRAGPRHCGQSDAAADVAAVIRIARNRFWEVSEPFMVINGSEFSLSLSAIRYPLCASRFPLPTAVDQQGRGVASEVRSDQGQGLALRASQVGSDADVGVAGEFAIQQQPSGGPLASRDVRSDSKAIIAWGQHVAGDEGQ